jgi:flagella basal body P-ring formation protein FlgA
MKSTSALMMLLIWAGSADAVVIRLRESAEVSSLVVRLADVAEILTDDAPYRTMLKEIELFPSPEAESPRWLDAGQIKDRLYAQGVRIDELEFVGARRVKVMSADARPAEPTPTARKEPVSWKAEIERVIRQSLPGNESTVAEVEIRIEAGRAITFLATEPWETWHLDVPAQWRDGWQEVTLTVVSGKEPLTFPFRVEIVPVRRVLSARRMLKRGEILQADDLIFVPADRTSNQSELFSSIEQATGLEVTREVASGNILRADDLRRPPVVFRGQPVNVHIRYGTAWLQKTFLAASDGGVGEWIEVYEANARNRRQLDYQVRVTGSHTAELPINAPPSRSALSSAQRSPAPQRRVIR